MRMWRQIRMPSSFGQMWDELLISCFVADIELENIEQVNLNGRKLKSTTYISATLMPGKVLVRDRNSSIRNQHSDENETQDKFAYT